MSVKEQFLPIEPDNEAVLIYIISAAVIFSVVFSIVLYVFARNTKLKLDKLKLVTPGVGKPIDSALFPTTTLKSNFSPVVTTNGNVPNAFGNLANKNYVFTGTFSVSLVNLTSPPANNYYDLSIRIGTSTLQVNYFTLPSKSTTYINVPITYLWNTYSTDGQSPTFYWTFSSYAGSPLAVTGTGGLTLKLTGVISPDPA